MDDGYTINGKGQFDINDKKMHFILRLTCLFEHHLESNYLGKIQTICN